ncbi:hypothetical protein GCM10009555_105150 [Acrocarpospora macrocephala]|uniref:Uncharacterized protein n=1 Tax=Acrocarpospora macrocephala TaxID=150177 RepID=A0A5M3WYT4_9ACTN|nr:hypothetical protein Amac_071830 [Acrocarpospora macrocephala]
MKLTPGHRRKGFAHQLLMRPAEMYSRKVSDFSLDEVGAVQFGSEGGRLAQLPVHFLQPPLIFGGAGLSENRDEIEIAKARLVVPTRERPMRPHGDDRHNQMHRVHKTAEELICGFISHTVSLCHTNAEGEGMPSPH